MIDSVRLTACATMIAYATGFLVVDISLTDLNAGDLGTQTADTLRNVANAAANTVCELYRNYPSGIIPSIGTSQPGQFTDALLRSLCAPRGTLPPPAQPPFQGGQCACESYFVTVKFPFAGNPNFQTDIAAVGPIGGLQRRKASGSTSPQLYNWYFLGGTVDCGGRREFGVVGNVTDDVTPEILSVVKSNSSPDLCGDPPPTYPPELPPTSFYDTNVSINIGGNTVNAPVTIIPTVFAPLTVFRPELNVKVGPINVNLSLGGVTFSPTFDIGPDISLPGFDPRPVPPTPTSPKDPANQKGCDLDPVIDLLEDIKECACEDGTLKTTAYGPSSGREISLPPNTRNVFINVVNIGNGVNQQSGAGSTRDVRFLGWYSFGGGTNPGERIPISFVQSDVIAPENAKHFAYSLNFDSTATLVVTYFEEA